ncbi:hypothetical protein ACO2Q0_18285 [Phenylobacterium sp. VNQ135]|uniref:hypothetical protein n=1 Tax=Phenylobacterium sp. VNQ135 TaxID=3400922 RepID=UPI003C091F17
MRSTLVVAVSALALFGAAEAAAQAAKAPAKAEAPAVNPTIRQPGWKTPRTAWGAPDLEGYWSNATLTPLTRNPRLTPKATLSAQEAMQIEKIWAKALADSDAQTDPDKSTEQLQAEFTQSELVKIRPDFVAAGGDVGGYNTFWIDPGNHIMEVNGEYRTSLLTTPNGQFPPRKAGAPTSGMNYRDSYDSYEVRGTGDRCIMGFGRNAGPPMLPNGYYNNNYRIVQGPDSVAIQVELIHDSRIVRLNGKHRTDGVRPWMGDSIGWYEGDTLVVETTNIPEGQALAGAWKNLKVTERFTRVSDTRLNYQFTVQDPDVWDAPWGGEYNFYPLNGVIYEYACHEGNYALPAILAGARHAEEQAAEAAKAKAAAPAKGEAKGKKGAD